MVRGLVGKWEERRETAASGEAERRNGKKGMKGGGSGGEVQIVYPLHVNKFVRRSSIGTPVRPQSPLQRSGLNEETVMRMPRPYRVIPTIKTPPEDPYLLSSWRGGYMSSVAHLHGTRRRCVRHGRHDHIRQDTVGGKRRTFDGKKHMLTKSRSGVYIPTGQMERRQMEATSPWISPMSPFGPSPGTDVLMEDADACPDCLQELDIKRREVYQASGAGVEDGSHLTYSATQRVADGSTQTVKRPPAAGSSGRYLYAPASHAHSREPSVLMDPELLTTHAVPTSVQRNVSGPAGDRGYDPAWHTTPYQPVRRTTPQQDFQEGAMDFSDRGLDLAWHATPHEPVRTLNKEWRSQQSSPTTTTATGGTDDLVFSKALSDGLNAVVVEHQGHLRRVVFNTNSDVSKVERLQRLSRELASVSNAIALASASKRKQASCERMPYSLVLDKGPTPSLPRIEPDTPRPAARTSSIPELLTLIEQTAGEFHLNNHETETAGPSDQYVNNRRQSLGATLGRGQSLIQSDEMHGMLLDLPSPGQQVAHRQDLAEVMKKSDEMMGVKIERPAVKSAVVDDEADAMGLEVTATPPRRFSNTVVQKIKDESRQYPPIDKSTPPARARKSLPTFVTTRPTGLVAESPASDEATFQTPPAETPAQPAKTEEPVEDSSATPALETADDEPPAATTSATTTPRAVEQSTQQQSHSFFPTFLKSNPFHRRTPNPPSGVNNDPNPNNDYDYPVPSTTEKITSPPTIAAQASPYRHAPSAPLDLYFAQHEDPGVRERKDVVRAAMRMEREGRRARRESAVGLGKKGVEVQRKGWFR